MKKDRYVLTINAGSATLKMAVFDKSFKKILSAQAEKIGQPGSWLEIDYNNNNQKVMKKLVNHQTALRAILNLVDKDVLNNIYKVAHRVVHGGEYYSSPVLIDKKVIKNIEKLSNLAPLHNPKNLAAILTAQDILPKAKHFALFDTAWHQTIPAKAYTYALPKKINDKYNIRKYGFHGLSHQYCVLEAAQKLKKPVDKLNLITVHLGSGASITAVKNGQSIDTSMGFTPLAGLTMGTRSGDIDVGIILYLLDQGFSKIQLDKMLNFDAGIKGLFASQDMRDVLTTAGYKIPSYKKPTNLKATKKQAQLVLDIFIYNVLKYVHIYLGVLKKVDAIVFTGGIGERNADIRNLILKNSIYKGKSLVVRANEELMMAKLILKK